MPHYQTQLSSPIEALKASNSLFNCLILLFQTDYFKHFLFLSDLGHSSPILFILHKIYHLSSCRSRRNFHSESLSTLYHQVYTDIIHILFTSILTVRRTINVSCKICFFTFALKHLTSCLLKKVALLIIFFVKSTSLYSSFASIFSHVSVAATQ